ncbi:MAG: trimethylamine--corrinoid protein Co-methyltransferase [Candidatus Poriferisodalaceae bacterium]
MSDIGIDILLPEAQELLAKAGAVISGDRVRFDPEMVIEHVAKAPNEFLLEARNPDHSVMIGGDHVVFAAVASPPNAGDIAGGRRTGNQADFRNLVRLSQHLNAIQINAGYPVEPANIHASVRHLHAIRDLLVLTDKAVNAYSLGADRNRDALEIVRLAHGLNEHEIDDHTIVHPIINTSFALAGAMAPVTIAGAVVQQNAEALAGICLTQLVRAGAPVVYGGFTSNVDMRSGSPAFGTPEFMQSLVVDDASMALEAIADVGPGGHFFGTQHTQDRYKNALFAPMVSDWRNFESWEEAGAPTADPKLSRLYPELLAEYEAPAIDPERLAAIEEFVARRVLEGGVATDY